jgi:hypothetical protein
MVQPHLLDHGDCRVSMFLEEGIKGRDDRVWLSDSMKMEL